MKKLTILIIMVLVLMPFKLNAQTTNDISINKLFIDFDSIIFNKQTESYDKCIDNALIILKTAPKSLESYYVMSMLDNIIQTDKTIEKIEKIKEKYYSDISNIETDTVEKLILLVFLANGIGAQSYDEKINNQKITIEWLNKVKVTCSNKDFAALATVLLFFDKENGYNNTIYFKENFPKHPFIPLVCLDIIAEHSIKGEYDQAIKEIEELTEKYKDIITPYRCKLKFEYYALISINYMLLGDINNAKKYVELIEKEEPNFHSLKSLKNKISK